MGEHYFSKNPQSKSDRTIWNTTLRGHTLTFTTDIGVFSKERIDFGSRLLIESFTEPTAPGKILDLGCGYGPVGLAIAASFPQRKIIMSDINERAISLATHNAHHNKLKNVEVRNSDRFTQIPECFAAILLNPPIRAGKAIVHQMFTESYQALNQAGEFWIVIQKKQGAPSAKKKLRELFQKVEVVQRSKGYYVYKSIKLD